LTSPKPGERARPPAAIASTALKWLVSYTGKNHFYRANRELGSAFKTEYILQFMLTLLEHISPVRWDNILLYGEFVLDRQLVRL
jgi:hypothetical protein